MHATPEYERNRLSRIKRQKGDDCGNGSNYEPNDEEEADDANEVS
jgi:hypothetical protein